MACEVPVIASKVGGLPEVVKDGADGFLVEPRDTRRMAERALLILREDSYRKELGARAREKAHRHFCSNKIIASYEAFYRSVIGRV